jgi:Fe2+ transport system protein B
MTTDQAAAEAIRRAATLRQGLSAGFRDEAVRSLFTEASRIALRAAKTAGSRRFDFDQRIDRIVTSPFLGLPLMGLMLAAVFWLTIAGANVPSAMLDIVPFRARAPARSPPRPARSPAGHNAGSRSSSQRRPRVKEREWNSC